MDTNIAQRIESKIKECFTKILGYVPEHRVVYESIGRGTAGTFRFSTKTFTFDPWFAERYTEDYIARTVPHEVAHMIQRIVYPKAKQSHGPEFRKIMSALGAPTATYHNYDVKDAPGRHSRNHQYKCACEGKVFNLTTRMHNSINKGAGRRCNACLTSIVYIGSNV